MKTIFGKRLRFDERGGMTVIEWLGVSSVLLLVAGIVGTWVYTTTRDQAEKSAPTENIAVMSSPADCSSRFDTVAVQDMVWSKTIASAGVTIAVYRLQRPLAEDTASLSADFTGDGDADDMIPLLASDITTASTADEVLDRNTPLGGLMVVYVSSATGGLNHADVKGYWSKRGDDTITFLGSSRWPTQTDFINVSPADFADLSATSPPGLPAVSELWGADSTMPAGLQWSGSLLINPQDNCWTLATH